MGRGIAILIFIAIPVAHVACALDVFRQWQTHDHPTATGFVTVSTFESVGGGSYAKWHFEYVYAVGDRSFTGWKLNEIHPASRIRPGRDTTKSHYPVGTEVQVHYNPDDPSEARIEPGVTNGTPAAWWLLFFLQLPLLAMAHDTFDRSAPSAEAATPSNHLQVAGGSWFLATIALLLVLGLAKGWETEPLVRDRFAFAIGGAFAIVVLACQARYFVHERRLRIRNRDSSTAFPSNAVPN